MTELTVTDMFCGAGGSTSGMVQIPGVRVILAANHWPLAIETHNTNHQSTDHDCADLSQVRPERYPHTDILWASPECTNHSQAKGIKRGTTQGEFDLWEDKPLPDEAAERSRATMWDVPRFAEFHKYKAVVIENVVDAYRWVMFPAWLMAMEALGYTHQIVWLNSMHAQAYGLPAPQSRDRMYVIFTMKGNKQPDVQKWTRPQAYCPDHGLIRAVQVFKKAEKWGRYRAQYLYKCGACGTVVEPGWLPASSAIDWSIEGVRIGDRKTALSPKTMARIEKGIERYWRPLVIEASGNTYDSADPNHRQHGDPDGYIRAWPTEEALRTLHTTASKGIALPPLITDGIRGEGTVQSTADPMLTQTTAQTKGVFYPPLMVPVEGRDGKQAASSSDAMRTQSTRNETGLLVPSGGTWRDDATGLSDVMPTRTTVETDALVIPLRNHNTAKSTGEPIDTVSAAGNHHALLMRNNTGGAEMTTPVTETMRTLTTGGHQSLLVPYYGNGTASPVGEPHRTMTTTDRYSLVSGSVDVDDCIFRMLVPDEVKRGMAFDIDYVLLGTKREQVRLAGNAVTPPAARDLMCAVAESLGADLELAA